MSQESFGCHHGSRGPMGNEMGRQAVEAASLNLLLEALLGLSPLSLVALRLSPATRHQDFADGLFEPSFHSPPIAPSVYSCPCHCVTVPKRPETQSSVQTDVHHDVHPLDRLATVTSQVRIQNNASCCMRPHARSTDRPVRRFLRMCVPVIAAEVQTLGRIPPSPTPKTIAATAS